MKSASSLEARLLASSGILIKKQKNNSFTHGCFPAFRPENARPA
jgi:hypothetical protein